MLGCVKGRWANESGSEPEINIDIYAPGVSNRTVRLYLYGDGYCADIEKTYKIPGPPVWPGE